MAVRRTIENLRERSKEDRTAIAAWTALAVVAILFLGWAVYFFNSIKATPAPDFQGASDSLNSSGLSQAGQALQQAYGSTTQFIESQGNLQLQQLGTSSYSQ
jgi:hypothetical protein